MMSISRALLLALSASLLALAAPAGAAPRPVTTEQIGPPGVAAGPAIGAEKPGPEEGEAAPDEEPPAQAIRPEDAPPVVYDLAKLPEPARRLREQIVAIARAGDIEKLRPIIEANPGLKEESFSGEDDPIDFLKSQSGDGEGREILAILLEILEAGFVHVDAGTPQDMYVWPYFARWPIEGLTGPQMVELFKLITAGDYEDMRNVGAYIFFRTGITPDGKWAYFYAGD